MLQLMLRQAGSGLCSTSRAIVLRTFASSSSRTPPDRVAAEPRISEAGLTEQERVEQRMETLAGRILSEKASEESTPGDGGIAEKEEVELRKRNALEALLGKERAGLAQLLQLHGVVVKGGQEQAAILMEALLAWREAAVLSRRGN